ncbi:MAG: hypothetical protein KDC46_07500 [Thermoleophilia bacterium]|nr:hypothetical protein [Thermoleophilia bacterium]
MDAHPSSLPPSVTGYPPRLPARATRREDGFGVLEIVVVIVVIAILLAAAMSSFRGAKRTTYYQSATAAAFAYADAIEAYMADNGQVPPEIGSNAWPSSSRADLIAGPVNVMLQDPTTHQPRHYAKASSLEKVGDGLVDFGTASSSAVPTAAAYITYSTSGGTYQLLVETLPKASGDEVLRCVVTNGATVPSGVKRC